MKKNILEEIEYAKFVIEKEINGLESLKKSINESFFDAVDLLAKKKGHVIVSGMGKPGHIGRKIAATFASTGTNSFFLHPAEASHGDLGMISEHDSLLILSWSGNTQELIPMISYANRFGIDIVGITGNNDSLLAKASNIKIILPKIEEACPHNLAPTTTTTMMLVIGDAIALSLLKRKEFNREDFKNLHPGGALGKRLLLVQDLMHEDTPIVKENLDMSSVIIEMTRKSYGSVCVVDGNNKIIGIITDGDLRRYMDKDILNLFARDVMTKNPKLINKDIFAQEALKKMNQNKITSLFVEENGFPIGILHVHDCLRAGIV